MLSLTLPRRSLILLCCLLITSCKKDQTPSDAEIHIDTIAVALPPAPPPFVSIAAGSDFGLALDTAGKVWAWGQSTDGQTSVPSDLGRVVQIAAGSHFAVALQENGKVRVWGGSRACEYKELDHAISIAANGNEAFATVLADGTVQLSGCFTFQNELAKGLQDIRSVALGQGFLAALTNKGRLLFRTKKTVDDFTNPAVPSDITGVKSITAGAHHVLALKNDGTVLAWGPNYEGENDIPEDLGKVAKLSAGYSASYALLENGSLRTWGNTKNGEDRLPPEMESVKDVSSGQFTCRLALDAAGKVFTWGDDPCDQNMPR